MLEFCLVRLFHVCVTVVGFLVATLDVSAGAALTPRVERTAALDESAKDSAECPSDCGAPLPGEPAESDGLDDDDDTTTTQVRQLGAPRVSGEIEFLAREAAPSSVLAERLFRPPIA
jgi:hypothetical protein